MQQGPWVLSLSGGSRLYPSWICLPSEVFGVWLPQPFFHALQAIVCHRYLAHILTAARLIEHLRKVKGFTGDDLCQMHSYQIQQRVAVGKRRPNCRPLLSAIAGTGGDLYVSYAVGLGCQDC